MHIFCRVGGHSARPSTLCNQGMYFSTCSRCDRDMTCSGSRWKLVAPGFRVVWKPVARTSAPKLPAAYVAPVHLALPREAKAVRTKRTRRWTLFASIAVPALNLLVGYCADRLKQWQAAEALRRHARQPILRITGPS